MKFKQVRRDWSPWFAWHPVQLTQSGSWVWLRRIERRAVVTHRFIRGMLVVENPEIPYYEYRDRT